LATTPPTVYPPAALTITGYTNDIGDVTASSELEKKFYVTGTLQGFSTVSTTLYGLIFDEKGNQLMGSSVQPSTTAIAPVWALEFDMSGLSTLPTMPTEYSIKVVYEDTIHHDDASATDSITVNFP
jgi:hypothetical protein